MSDEQKIDKKEMILTAEQKFFLDKTFDAQTFSSNLMEIMKESRNYLHFFNNDTELYKKLISPFTEIGDKQAELLKNRIKNYFYIKNMQEEQQKEKHEILLYNWLCDDWEQFEELGLKIPRYWKWTKVDWILKFGWFKGLCHWFGDLVCLLFGPFFGWLTFKVFRVKRKPKLNINEIIKNVTGFPSVIEAIEKSEAKLKALTCAETEFAAESDKTPASKDAVAGSESAPASGAQPSDDKPSETAAPADGADKMPPKRGIRKIKARSI